jgi:hypothetical protein
LIHLIILQNIHNNFPLISEPKRISTLFDQTVCARTNAHELVQFGLSLLQFMLKREMLKSAAFSPFVDPFVSLVIDSMKSQHVKVLCKHYSNEMLV